METVIAVKSLEHLPDTETRALNSRVLPPKNGRKRKKKE